MGPLSRFFIAVALVAVASGEVDAASYSTARRLYQDCAATGAANAGRRQRCADYLVQLLDNWNLNQDNNVCARHVGKELPDAYVRYWRARGLGFLSGRFKSAETSVNEFLDTQRRPCPDDKPR